MAGWKVKSQFSVKLQTELPSLPRQSCCECSLRGYRDLSLGCRLQKLKGVLDGVLGVGGVMGFRGLFYYPKGDL